MYKYTNSQRLVSKNCVLILEPRYVLTTIEPNKQDIHFVHVTGLLYTIMGGLP
jgi:hypothetical protein